jgi:hypothetical protein
LKRPISLCELLRLRWPRGTAGRDQAAPANRRVLADWQHETASKEAAIRDEQAMLDRDGMHVQRDWIWFQILFQDERKVFKNKMLNAKSTQLPWESHTC